MGGLSDRAGAEREVRTRRRPGRFWLFFYGRKRRGFPGLAVGLLVATVVLGLLFGLPGGAEWSRLVILLPLTALVLVLVGALVLIALAAIRPPRERRRGRR